MIRGAEPADRDEVKRIVDAAYSIYLDRAPFIPAPMVADYEALIAQQRVFVSVTDERIEGLIVMWRVEDHLYIDNVAVDPGNRGVGLGARLLKFAEQEALAAGLNELRLYTGEVMTENIAYYPRRGFVETHRAVDDGRPRVYFSRKLEPPVAS